MKRTSIYGPRIRIALFALAAGALALRIVQVDTIRAGRVGKLSANEAIAMGERLCTMGAPTGLTYRLSASVGNITDKDGHKRRFWLVDCTDKNGQDLSHAVIDADTGTPVQLAFTDLYPDRGGAPIRSRSSVFGRAFTYLESSRFVARPQVWRLERIVDFSGVTWAVWLTSVEYSAIVRMNTRTGKLMQATLSPLITDH